MRLAIKRNTIVESIAALFIFLFIYTGYNKFISIVALKKALLDYPILQKVPNLAAWGLPIVELIVAILLFLPRTKLIGLYSSLVLMSSFTAYLIYMLAFTPNLPCTCGGLLQELTWPQHLIFNTFFVGLAVIGVWQHKKALRAKEMMESTNVALS